MNCVRYAPLLSATPEEIDDTTAADLADHLASCGACRAEATRFALVRRGLGDIADREPEPPADLVPSIIARTTAHPRRRAVPLVPIPPVELARVIQENREAIVGAGAVALVAAGTAWAIWKGLRSLAKPSVQQA